MVRADDRHWLAQAAQTGHRRGFTVVWEGIRAAKSGRVANGPACSAVLIRRLVCAGLIARASSARNVEGFALTYDGRAALEDCA